MDEWTEDGRMDGQTDAQKNNVALVHPYHDGEVMKHIW